MSLKHIKRFLVSLTVRKDMYNTARCHISLKRLAKILKYANIPLARLWGKGASHYCWQACKLVQLLWKEIWDYLTKLYMHLPFDSGIPLLGIYPRVIYATIQKCVCTTLFITTLLIITKHWKETKCLFIGELLKQLW